MKAMLEVIVKGLVDDPTSVRIDEINGQDGVTYEVNVATQDLGKVIGKEGRIANALRALVSSVAAGEGRSASVEINS